MLVSFAVVVGVLAILYWVAARRLDAPDHSQFDLPDHPLQKTPDAISAQHEDTLAQLAAMHAQAAPREDVAAARQRLEALFYREVRADTRISPVSADGVLGEWVIAAGANPEHRLLYLHGGAFRLGSPKSHRGLTEALSALAGVAVLAIDYRKQPEHKLLHCHEDAQTAYRWVLEHGPEGSLDSTAAGKLFIAGDSAGGNLALAVTAWARDRGLRLPDAVATMAPATDATFSGPSWRANMTTDAFLGPSFGRLGRVPRGVLLIGGRMLNGVAPNDPRVSPLLGELAGLPPTLIQVSRDEMLFDDARRYTNKAQAAGSPVELQVWPKLVHVFQGFAPDLPEANEALADIGAFLRAQIDSQHSQRLVD